MDLNHQWWVNSTNLRRFNPHVHHMITCRNPTQNSIVVESQMHSPSSRFTLINMKQTIYFFLFRNSMDPAWTAYFGFKISHTFHFMHCLSNIETETHKNFLTYLAALQREKVWQSLTTKEKLLFIHILKRKKYLSYTKNSC